MELDGLALTDDQRALLHGDAGAAVALGMRMATGLARLRGASRLIPIDSAHLDGCLYHGQAGLDFVQRLVDSGGEVTVPTPLNVGSLDLLHPDLVRAPTDEATAARLLMDAYPALGARPTWTCAPYQAGHRPELGRHVAWAESNAIVFCNSVLGARTDRYGDFLDVSAAVTGLVPDAGLHRTENRRATLVIDCSGLSDRLLATDALYPVLGYLAGEAAGTAVPVFTGLAEAAPGEDALKAFGATAASSGGVALFHVVGVTPEAPMLVRGVTGERSARGADGGARRRCRPSGTRCVDHLGRREDRRRQPRHPAPVGHRVRRAGRPGRGGRALSSGDRRVRQHQPLRAGRGVWVQ